MGFRAQMEGGVAQLHRFFSDDNAPCCINGRSFKPVNGRKGYEKRQSDAGFIAAVDSVFDALNVDISGLNLDGTVGQILTQGNRKFVVRRYETGQLTTVFYTEAKNV